MKLTQAAGYVDAFPAHAGMNRQVLPEGKFRGSVPRTRGDEPAFVRRTLR